MQCEEPDQFILRLEWDSEDGHLKGFRSSPEFGAFFAHVRPYVHDIEEMRQHKLTQVVGKNGVACIDWRLRECAGTRFLS